MTNAKLIYTNVFNSDGSVSETTMDILYSQLEPAKPERGIRADGLPKREHYEAWVRSRPYKHWFIVTEDQGGAEEIIGQVYLTKSNHIGLGLLNCERRKHLGDWMVQWLVEHHRKGPFFALIDPNDEVMNKAFIDLGGKRTIAPLFYNGKVYPAEPGLAPQPASSGSSVSSAM
jgi:hypothetical protein